MKYRMADNEVCKNTKCLYYDINFEQHCAGDIDDGTAAEQCQKWNNQKPPMTQIEEDKKLLRIYCNAPHIFGKDKQSINNLADACFNVLRALATADQERDAALQEAGDESEHAAEHMEAMQDARKELAEYKRKAMHDACPECTGMKAAEARIKKLEEVILALKIAGNGLDSFPYTAAHARWCKACADAREVTEKSVYNPVDDRDAGTANG